MASNLRKAGSVIRSSFWTKKYTIFDVEENNYILSPKTKRPEDNNNSRSRSGGSRRSGKPRKVAALRSSSVCSESQHVLGVDGVSSTKSGQSGLRRRTSLTQSMRLAVGTLKQKLKKPSKQRQQQQTTPKRAGTRSSSTGSQEVHLYSPFKIETPATRVVVGNRHSRIKVSQTRSAYSANLETPTRLRREVESLTAGMQALSALTPNTLHNRCRARKSSPLATKTVRTPRSTRKRIVLEY